MNKYWREEPWEFNGIAGTKFYWPKDRPICFFIGQHKFNSGKLYPETVMLPTFSLNEPSLKETTLDEQLATAVNYYVKEQTVFKHGISCDGLPYNEELLADGGMTKYLEWINKNTPEFDKTKLHIHLVFVDGYDEIAICIDNTKRTPVTDYFRPQ